MQTHASYVFLAGGYVYKIKKPVDFGFLDFSTLARRRRFCEREIALNRRLAPDVYLDVVPIRRAGGSFRLGGAGDAVEYAVRMRRLPAGGFASTLLARGRLSAGHIDLVAARLSRFYREETARSRRRSPDRQRRSIDDNLALIRAHAATAGARSTVAALMTYTRTFRAAHSRLLARRQREGRILDCHGDLRLEHVHIEGSRIRIYDCIEFNDRLRTIDVANDIAFLAMDLDYEGRPDLATRFAQRIVRSTGDLGIEPLLDYYKCYRAAVRHKVESLRAAEPEVRMTERHASSARASRFLRLALRYATLGSHPTIVMVMGQVACGKSTLAARLAGALGVGIVSSDVTRKQLTGLPLGRRPSDAVRTRIYSSVMSRRVYATLMKHARRDVRAGHSVVLDATFGRRADRDAIRALAADVGAACIFIEVVTPAAVRRRRLAARARARESVSDARLADFAALAARYQPCSELAPGSLLRVRSRNTPDTTLAATLLALARKRGQAPLRSSR